MNNPSAEIKKKTTRRKDITRSDLIYCVPVYKYVIRARIKYEYIMYTCDMVNLSFRIATMYDDTVGRL